MGRNQGAGSYRVTHPLGCFPDQGGDIPGVGPSSLPLSPPCFALPAPCVSRGGVGVSAVLGMAMSATPVILCALLGLDQLKALQKNYGRLQQDVLQFQKNQTNLERKFSYDL